MPEFARWLSASVAVVVLAASSHAIAQVLTGTATAADGDSWSSAVSVYACSGSMHRNSIKRAKPVETPGSAALTQSSD